jgi:phosphoribosylformimino-5-aminoimidazole carboxamide ribotide isomerase
LIIIPAVDIKDGKCVRLLQGRFDEVTVYSRNPAEMARNWQDKGAERIHVVDLDGSLAGSPRNKEVIRDIVQSVGVPIQLGGGIRDLETVESYLRMGIARIILGTAAMKDRYFFMEACRSYPGTIILGIDARDGKAAVEAWTEATGESAIDVAKSYEVAGLDALIYTDIGRDGMERGVNVEATMSLAESVRIPVIASGGVSSLRDIVKLLEVEKSGVMGVIIGKALYTGAIRLDEAISLARGAMVL